MMIYDFIFINANDIDTLVGKRFSIKQILNKLNLSRKHIVHTLTKDVRRTSQLRINKTTKLLSVVANVQKTNNCQQQKSIRNSAILKFDLFSITQRIIIGSNRKRNSCEIKSGKQLLPNTTWHHSMPNSHLRHKKAALIIQHKNKRRVGSKSVSHYQRVKHLRVQPNTMRVFLKKAEFLIFSCFRCACFTMLILNKPPLPESWL